ncbi:hypothetical protein TWF481_000185 [Arthrobotrys musiformis]
MVVPRCDVRVLVPGAGLGRLAFDIARKGYSAEGNEFSYHQLIASNFILNHTTVAEEFTLYPFCHGFSHHRSLDLHLREILVPDVHPGTELNQYLEFRTQPDTYGHRAGGPQTYRYKPSQFFSMSAGEFVSSYNTEEAHESFDCVATCFFIDTARNLLDYLDTIRNVLREGGAWINHGPLLWHFEGSDATEEKNSTTDRGKYGDLRGFDQIQADSEDAEVLHFPTSSDGGFGNPSFATRGNSSRTRVGSGDVPSVVENGPATESPADGGNANSTGGGASASAAGEAGSSTGNVESPQTYHSAPGSVKAGGADQSPPTSAGNHVRGDAETLADSGPSSNRRSRASSTSRQGQRSQHSHDGEKEWNGSLEFTLEDVFRLIDLYGFEILERRATEPSGYINDVKSMGRYIYESEFWVAVKKRKASDVVEQSIKKFDTKKDAEPEVCNDTVSEAESGGVRIGDNVLET